ncbi:MAG: diguanylate cyclase [Planococcus donghaensis]
MATLLFFFLENMALIIALLYIALKVKEFWFPDLTESKRLVFLSIIFISFLTFSVMHKPYLYMGMRLDLREVALYFISYIGGWKVGLLSSIFPSVFRYYLGGPTAIMGILQAILLPVIIGSLFRNKQKTNKFFSLIDLKRMMIGLLVFEVIKSALMLVTTPATLSIIVPMAIFAGIAVLVMGLMTNGENYHVLLRKELEVHSNQDPLTQLANMRFFRKEIQTFVSNDVPIAIIMLDVDYFKSYNDAHGHQKGDAVLRSIGQLMKDNTRPNDFVARYGGEEFIICIAQPFDEHKALEIAEKVRTEIERYPFDGQELQPKGNLTVSLGISLYSANKTLDQLIGEADQALFQSKRSGRNQVTVYTEVTQAEAISAL